MPNTEILSTTSPAAVHHEALATNGNLVHQGIRRTLSGLSLMMMHNSAPTVKDASDGDAPLQAKMPRRLSFSGMRSLVTGQPQSEQKEVKVLDDQSVNDGSFKKKSMVRRTKSSDGSSSEERRRNRRRTRDAADADRKPRRARSSNRGLVRRTKSADTCSTAGTVGTTDGLDALTDELEKMARLLNQVDDPSKIIMKHIKISTNAA